jgi:hypothetical protein
MHRAAIQRATREEVMLMSAFASIVATRTRHWRRYFVPALVGFTLLTGGAVCGPVNQNSATTPASVAPSAAAVRPTPPPPVVRTPIPGAAKGGLFADEITNLATVDASNWKTYSNTKYAFKFQYPADWQLVESDSTGRHGPHGEPAYPLHAVEVRNPLTDQGQKIPGENCTDAANDCPGPPPGYMRFAVVIEDSQCNIAGSLIASDTASVSGRQGARCVVEYPNDKSRSVAISFPLGDGNYLVVELDKGNSVPSPRQAVLETILSTFSFVEGATPEAATPQGATPQGAAP